jgi:hypothetical protein
MLLARTAKGGGSILFFVAPFFAAIPLGFLAGNLAAWCLPPARRAFEREARGVARASFARAQKDILKVSLVLVPIGMGAGLLGAVLIR